MSFVHNVGTCISSKVVRSEEVREMEVCEDCNEWRGAKHGCSLQTWCFIGISQIMLLLKFCKPSSKRTLFETMY